MKKKKKKSKDKNKHEAIGWERDLRKIRRKCYKYGDGKNG